MTVLQIVEDIHNSAKFSRHIIIFVVHVHVYDETFRELHFRGLSPIHEKKTATIMRLKNLVLYDIIVNDNYSLVTSLNNLLCEIWGGVLVLQEVSGRHMHTLNGTGVTVSIRTLLNFLMAPTSTGLVIKLYPMWR